MKIEESARTFITGVEFGLEHPKCPWISVKERLPEFGQRIFYTYAIEFSIVRGSYRRYGEIYYPEQHITDMMDYWMPIPELPADEEKEDKICTLKQSK